MVLGGGNEWYQAGAQDHALDTGQLVVIVAVSHYPHSVCGLDTWHSLLLWQLHALPQSTHFSMVGGFMWEELAVHNGYLVLGVHSLDGAGHLACWGRHQHGGMR